MNTINKKLKVLSLFDGISCARVAIERAGFKIEEYYASEIDKYAMQVAEKNYPDTIQLGSVTDLKGEDVKDIDILIGGSPCQDLSIAGKRKGLCGARSGLFYEYVRIRDEVKPKYFILENVNSMSKEAKDTISKELGVEPIMINAALVSAQNRKRLFWVGKLIGDKYEQVDIELPEDRGILLKDILEEEVKEKYFLNGKRIDYVLNRPKNFAVKINPDKTNTLRTNYGNASANETYVSTPIKIGQFNKGGQGYRIYSKEGKSVSLSALGGGGGAKTGLYLTNSKGKTHQQDLLQTTEGKCRTIPSGTHGSTPHLLKTIMPDNRIRKLTPIECERLQGLPDNYTEGVSNTQRYKGLGNAFNVDVVAHIIKSLSL